MALAKCSNLLPESLITAAKSLLAVSSASIAAGLDLFPSPARSKALANFGNILSASLMSPLSKASLNFTSKALAIGLF